MSIPYSLKYKQNKKMDVDENQNMLSFYRKNMEESSNIYTNIFKNLQIDNIRNPYYNTNEEGIINLKEIVHDYMFIFLQHIIINKNYFPQIIENTNDLYVFFLNILYDLSFIFNSNKNIQNIINELKAYEHMQNGSVDENEFIKNMKTLTELLNQVKT